MASDTLVLLELLLVLALVLGLGGYELWSLRRDRRKSERERERD